MQSMKPILFSTPMVQAIQAGRKTMTRRVIKFPEGLTGSRQAGEVGNPDNPLGLFWAGGIKRPKYQPGDILWVRETWARRFDGSGKIYYKADENLAALVNRENDTWRPSIFMPREAARIFLRVTNVRVERIQDITEEDAVKEGCLKGDRYYGERSTPAMTAKQSFMWLWDKLNAKRGYGWDVNPWVWVYEFEREEQGNEIV